MRDLEDVGERTGIIGVPSGFYKGSLTRNPIP